MATDEDSVKACAELAIENEIPNVETLAAFKEVEDMKAYPERYKRYTDISEMMKDLLSE